MTRRFNKRTIEQDQAIKIQPLNASAGGSVPTAVQMGNSQHGFRDYLENGGQSGQNNA